MIQKFSGQAPLSMAARPGRWFAILIIAGILMILGPLGPSVSRAAVWYVDASNSASDANPGTAQQPVQSVAKAVSLAKPGDTVVFAAGTYPCSGVTVPDGSAGSADHPALGRQGKGDLHATTERRTILRVGSYNTVDGIEFHMTSDTPRAPGSASTAREHVIIRNCRFFACQVGVSATSAHVSDHHELRNGLLRGLRVHLCGSGDGTQRALGPRDECRHVEVRNCYLHDAGWNVKGTEGYGVTANGAVEYLVIENCQIDNNTGDGILYEDWAVHTTARYNVIRGTGIAAIWIDNASMSIFDNNYLRGEQRGGLALRRREQQPLPERLRLDPQQHHRPQRLVRLRPLASTAKPSSSSPPAPGTSTSTTTPSPSTSATR